MRVRQLFLAFVLVACGDPEIADDCTRRICASDAGTSMPPPMQTDAGSIVLDDGAVIWLDAGPGPVVPGTDGGPGAPGVDAGPGGCVPSWQCTSWQTACDGSDDATRTCTDAAGCGVAPPASMVATTLHRLDVNFFRCRVQPIFDAGCDQFACHGTDDERPLRVYSRVMWRIDPLLRGNESARAMDPLTTQEWCRNYDSARSFWTSDPAASELLRQPLEPGAGGLSHVGVHLFANTSDADYQTILQWLSGATLASCDAGFNAHP